MNNQSDQYHYINENEYLMSLMDDGYTREQAEDIMHRQMEHELAQDEQEGL